MAIPATIFIPITRRTARSILRFLTRSASIGSVGAGRPVAGTIVPDDDETAEEVGSLRGGDEAYKGCDPSCGSGKECTVADPSGGGGECEVVDSSGAGEEGEAVASSDLD